LKRQEGERENNHVSDYSGNPEIVQLAAHPAPGTKNGSPKAAAFVPLSRRAGRFQ
jgi:hypothetical protein